jgi:hypothetical protein
MTLRLRYLTCKLRALCWVLRWLRAGRLSRLDARKAAGRGKINVLLPSRYPWLCNGMFS